MARRRRRTKPRDPAALGSLIEGELERLDQPPPLPLDIARAWEPALGERIASRSRPIRLKGKTLHVRVNSSAWMNELQMLSPVIIERLQELSPSTTIREVRFKLGPLPPPSVGIRSEDAAERQARIPAERPFPAAIEEALARIDDAELKQTIEETLKNTLDS